VSDKPGIWVDGENLGFKSLFKGPGLAHASTNTAQVRSVKLKTGLRSAFNTTQAEVAEICTKARTLSIPD